MSTDRHKGDEQKPAAPAEAVPPEKLSLFTAGKGATILDDSTRKAASRIGELMESVGEFAFCVNPRTGHVIIADTEVGHPNAMRAHGVPTEEHGQWSVGGVLSGNRLEYTSLAAVDGMSPREVYDSSNRALTSAGLPKDFEFQVPDALKEAPKGTQRVARGLTPKGREIPQYSSNNGFVVEGGFAYTKYYIPSGYTINMASGTGLSHDRAVRRLIQIGGWDVFNSLERGEGGDFGAFVPNNYQTVLDRRSGDITNQASGGDGTNHGYMIVRAKAEVATEAPDVFDRLQRIFELKGLYTKGD
jgi:hypothetical protein